MAYDASKDITLFKTPESEDKLVVEVKSYNNGPAKISFLRSNKYNDTIIMKPAYRLQLSDFTYFGNYWAEVCKIIQEYDKQISKK